MMSRIAILSLALAGLLLTAGSSRLEGQTVPSDYHFFEHRQEAGVFVGYTSQGTGRFGYGPSPGLLYGARYGVHLGGPFGLEGVFGYSPTTRDVVDPTREEGSRVVGEADVKLLSIDARLKFSLTGDRSWKGLNPLLFVGAGLIWDAAGESDAENLLLPEDKFGFGRKFVAPIGGGIRWVPGERFLVRADLALTMFRLKTPPGYRNPDRAFGAVGEKEWVSGPTFSLGAGFRF